MTNWRRFIGQRLKDRMISPLTRLSVKLGSFIMPIPYRSSIFAALHWTNSNSRTSRFKTGDQILFVFSKIDLMKGLYNVAITIEVGAPNNNN